MNDQLTPPFDLIFITYDEPRGEENWKDLQARVPSAKRVHGVKGIARAWKRASEVASTSHFFTMDGDSQLMENFDFELDDFQGLHDERVHVYRCLNHVNGLVYGYGSIHLFPTKLVREFTDLEVVDFTLNVATKGFCIQPRVASKTCFNTSAYIAWKSGFREASKLASMTNAYVHTTPDPRSAKRLQVWCMLGRDVDFGNWCMLGARMGAIFGFTYADKPDQLALISEHQWFQDEFAKIERDDPEQLLLLEAGKLQNFDFPIQEIDAERSRLMKSWLFGV